MRGNIIWFISGGAITGVLWLLSGLFWCCTIVGITIGKQCFKISKLCFLPFGKEVMYCGGAASFLLNILWISSTGWALAIEAISLGIVCCLTIVGIPFGKQYFKIAELALAPFGKKIR